MLLHRQTKDQLARDLEAARLDLVDQRATFKSSMTAMSKVVEVRMWSDSDKSPQKNSKLEAKVKALAKPVTSQDEQVQASLEPLIISGFL